MKRYRAHALRSYECYVEFDQDEMPTKNADEEARWIIEDQPVDQWVELEMEVEVEEIE